jgi:hypothetical protein
MDAGGKQSTTGLTWSAVQTGELMILIVDVTPDRRPATATTEVKLAPLTVAPRGPPVPVTDGAPRATAITHHDMDARHSTLITHTASFHPALASIHPYNVLPMIGETACAWLITA